MQKNLVRWVAGVGDKFKSTQRRSRRRASRRGEPFMRPGPCRNRGAVMVYVVIVLVAFIGFVGLALDWGYVFLTGQQLQNAADAASLAGAQKVFNGPAAVHGAATGIAEENYAGGKTVGLAENADNDPEGD